MKRVTARHTLSLRSVLAADRRLSWSWKVLTTIDRSMDRKAHWDRVYATKASDEVSWFQPEPTVSLQLLERTGLAAAT
jgi:hypothetical protein